MFGRGKQSQEDGGVVGTHTWLSPSISGSDDYKDTWGMNTSHGFGSHAGALSGQV